MLHRCDQTVVMLRNKVLFASDYPLITPDRWLADSSALSRIDPPLLGKNDPGTLN